MAKRRLQMAEIRLRYGATSLHIFYPDAFENNINYTYRDIVDLYEKCLLLKDVDSINLLNETYDLKHVFDVVSNSDHEISYNCKYSKIQKNKHNTRIAVRNRRKCDEVHVGSSHFRKWFIKNHDNTYSLSARTVVYQMKYDDVVSLLKLNSPKDDLNYNSKTVIELYELLLRRENINELLIYYIKNMLNGMFPIEELEKMESGEINIVNTSTKV